jgi:hypothetical protein
MLLWVVSRKARGCVDGYWRCGGRRWLGQKMEAVRSFETSATIYKTTQWRIKQNVWGECSFLEIKNFQGEDRDKSKLEMNISLIEKLIVDPLAKTLPSFMRSEGSFTGSTQPVTGHSWDRENGARHLILFVLNCNIVFFFTFTFTFTSTFT